jgi:hypothetical protein
VSAVGEIDAELRAAGAGIDATCTTVAVTADALRDVAARMATVGFTGIGESVTRLSAAVEEIAAALVPVRESIATGLALLRVTVGTATPQHVIAGLTAARHSVSITCGAIGTAGVRTAAASRMTTEVFRGGAPAPTLGRLSTIVTELADAMHSVTAAGKRLDTVIRDVANVGSDGTRDSSGDAAPPPVHDMTWPTGKPGAPPTGRRTRSKPGDVASTIRSHQRENDSADTLAEHAYRVHQNPSRPEIMTARHREQEPHNPEKRPDYLVEGRVFDCYSPSPGRSVRGIWSAVEEKVVDGQAQRVVISLHDWRGDLDALRRQFAQWPIAGLKEVKAVTADRRVIQIPHA